MKTITKRITGLTLGLALLAGVGASVAAAYTLPVEANAAESNGTASFTLSSADDVTVEGVKASFRKGSGGTAPTWYSEGLRLYAKNTVTISSTTNTITEISFTWEKRSSKALADVSADVGTYVHSGSAGGTGTWSGSSNTIVFTLGSSGQLQLNTFKVTYEGSAPSTFGVTYNGNGNTDGTVPVDETVYDSGATVTVLGNTGSLEKTGYTFSGWNTKTDGTGTTYVADDTFTITQETTLFAKWTANDATISFSLNGGEGTTPSSISSKYDEKITLPASTGITREGYSFTGWNENAEGTGKTYSAESSYTVKGSTTLYAKWSELGAKYRLVKDISTLSVGDVISIAAVSTESNAEYSVAMSSQNKNNRAKTDVTISDEVFVSNVDVAEVILEKSGDDWLFKTIDGYLCASGGTGSNYLTSAADSTSLTTHWDIEIDDVSATIVCVDPDTTRNEIRYNSSNSIFSCYGSGQNDVQIYKKLDSATEWATSFYDALKGDEGVCDPSGNTDTAKLKDAWDKQAEEYAKLTDAAKNTIVAAEASEVGTIIQKAVQIYDFCVTKYDSTICSQFITGRTPHDGGNVIDNNNKGIYIAIIAVTSLVAVSAIGGFLYIKRSKKED